MTYADIGILFIIGLSMAFSFRRGFFHEAIGLIGLIVALWGGFTYMEVAGEWFVDWIDNESVRLMAGFLVVLIVVLLVAAFIGRIVGTLVKNAGVGPLDRIFGMAFGAVRGALIVVGVVLLARLTPVTEYGWWTASQLLPPFEQVADQVGPIISRYVPAPPSNLGA